MHKSVIWSPLSEKNLEIVLEYLENNWNRLVVTRFIDQIDTLISQIAKNPKQFPIINKKRKVRKCVLTKQNTLFCREQKNAIEILRVF